MKIRTYYTSSFMHLDWVTAYQLQIAAQRLGQKCDILPRNDGLPILASYPAWGVGGLDFGYRFNTTQGTFEASKVKCIPDRLISLVSLEDGHSDGYFDVIEHNQVNIETMVALMQSDGVFHKRYEATLELCEKEIKIWYKAQGYESVRVLLPCKLNTNEYRLPAYCGKCDIPAYYQDGNSFYIFCIAELNKQYTLIVAEPNSDNSIRQIYSQGGWHNSLYNCVEFTRNYLYGLTKKATVEGLSFKYRFWNCYGAAMKFEDISDNDHERIAYKNESPYKVGDRVVINPYKWYTELKDQFGAVEYSDRDGDFSQLMSEYCGQTMTVTEQMCDNQYKLNNLPYWFPDWCFKKAPKEIEVRQYESRAYKNSKTYLMHDSNTGYTKIGMSVNPRQRERTLQSEKPTITLFRVCDTLVEKKLHGIYAAKRVRGEWFDLTESDIEKICNDYQFHEVN